jgi:glutamyl-tRNA reductase
VIVVGAGAVGRQVVECLAGSARVTLVYRARSPRPEFVQATGARTVRFDSLADELARADAVITAIKSGSPCLRRSDLPRDRPLVLIDLGMPRNIDPEVRTLPNVRLVDLEELHARFASAGSNPEQDAAVASLAEAYLETLRGELWEPWVSAWLRSAEVVRRREVANARRFLGTLTPEQEAAVDRLTHRLLTRLVVPPAQRMRSLPVGPDGDHDRQLVLRLLGPDLDDPR